MCCKTLKSIACAALVLSILDCNLVGIIAGAIVVCACCGGPNQSCCIQGWMLAAGILTLIGSAIQVILGIHYYANTEEVCEDWFADALVDECTYGFTSECLDFLQFIDDFCKEGGILDMIGIAMIIHGLAIGVTSGVLFIMGYCKAKKEMPAVGA